MPAALSSNFVAVSKVSLLGLALVALIAVRKRERSFLLREFLVSFWRSRFNAERCLPEPSFFFEF